MAYWRTKATELPYRMRMSVLSKPMRAKPTRKEPGEKGTGNGKARAKKSGDLMSAHCLKLNVLMLPWCCPPKAEAAITLQPDLSSR
jgi:hypothetical protein